MIDVLASLVGAAVYSLTERRFVTREDVEDVLPDTELREKETQPLLGRIPSVKPEVDNLVQQPSQKLEGQFLRLEDVFPPSSKKEPLPRLPRGLLHCASWREPVVVHPDIYWQPLTALPETNGQSLRARTCRLSGTNEGVISLKEQGYALISDAGVKSLSLTLFPRERITEQGFNLYDGMKYIRAVRDICGNTYVAVVHNGSESCYPFSNPSLDGYIKVPKKFLAGDFITGSVLIGTYDIRPGGVKPQRIAIFEDRKNPRGHPMTLDAQLAMVQSFY
jgi:hypothetical protein